MNFEKEVELFCDEYCKFPNADLTQEQLEEKCDGCPIYKLVERLEQVEIPQVPSEPSWKDRFLNTFLGGRQ